MGEIYESAVELREAIREQTQEQIKIAEALIGSLNDIFCAISDLKGEKMSPEDTGQGNVEKEKEVDRLATLQAAINQQARLIFALRNALDALKADIVALRAGQPEAGA